MKFIGVSKAESSHRIKKYVIKPYDIPVIIHSCENVHDAFKESGLAGEIYYNTVAFTWSSDRRSGIHLFFPNNAATGTIAHEAFHVICLAFARVDLRFGRDSEEAWAYHLDELVQVCVEFVHKDFYKRFEASILEKHGIKPSKKQLTKAKPKRKIQKLVVS